MTILFQYELDERLAIMADSGVELTDDVIREVCLEHQRLTREALAELTVTNSGPRRAQ